ncbi:MAG: hypothetical protein ACQ9MH_02120 [Nitrospinales bacterium]
MGENSQILSWLVGGILLIIFTWTLMSLFIGNLPWKLIDASRPGQKIFGIALIIVLGIAGLAIFTELLGWVWNGIKHILLLDMEDI